MRPEPWVLGKAPCAARSPAADAVRTANTHTRPTTGRSNPLPTRQKPPGSAWGRGRHRVLEDGKQAGRSVEFPK